MKKAFTTIALLILFSTARAEQLTFNLTDSPARGGYESSTLSDVGWTNLEVTRDISIDSVKVDYTWFTDDRWFGKFVVKSPAATQGIICFPNGDTEHPAGTYSITLQDFNSESSAGTWSFDIIDEDTWEGGFQATDVTFTVYYTVPTADIKLAMVKDINSGSGNSYTVDDDDVTRLIIDGVLYFAADDGTHGRELWKSDGTESGTVLVKDIYSGSSSSYPTDLTEINGTLYFVANDGSYGYELWKSDGTEGGTERITDLYAGSSSSSPNDLVVLNDTLYFSAYRSSDQRQLWRSDGTTGGTARVKLINASGSALNSSGCYMMVMNSTLYFTATDGSNGYELWTSDGTESGTVLVKNIHASSDSYPAELTAVNGQLFFIAQDSNYGREIWVSDGTADGTVMLKDIRSGTGSSMPFELTGMNNKIYFFANDYNLYGNELWTSDGTTEGTALVKDINSGSSDSHGSYSGEGDTPVVFNSELYFYASDGTNGQELWKTDGTEGGTVLVKDINSGSSNALPFYYCQLDSKLYFSASDADDGKELWSTDGTDSGTAQVSDIRDGSTSSSPVELFAMGNALYFWANNGSNGLELWKYTPTEASSGSVEVSSATQVSCGDDTGINIDFTGTSITQGYIDVAIYSHQPGDTTGLPAITIADYSIEITELGGFSFTGGNARIYIDPALFPCAMGFSGEPTVSIHVYHRDSYGSGTFTDTNVDLAWDGSYYYFDTGSFSEFVFVYEDDQSLPVSLAEYSCQVKDGGVQLTWATHSEVNHQGFNIERRLMSEAAGSWQQIAGFDQNSGLRNTGNSSEYRSYTYTDVSVLPHTHYEYRLVMVDVDGSSRRTVGQIVETGDLTPLTFSLSSGYPNPFNPVVHFEFTLDKAAEVTASVYNVRGQLVKTLLDSESREPGRYVIVWEGDDDQGESAPSGLYFIKLTQGKKHKVKKVILAR